MVFDYAKYQPLFSLYGMKPEGIGKLMVNWQEKHRHYHSEEHLAFLINSIELLKSSGEINEQEEEILLMTAFFHDAIFDPTRDDNEEKSELFFRELTILSAHSELISKMILETKNHEPSLQLSKIFIGLDLSILTRSNEVELIAYEKKIMKEFQFVDHDIYKNSRIAFLKNFSK